MNSLAGELTRSKPNDRRRGEIVKEMSQLSLLSASLKGANHGWLNISLDPVLDVSITLASW